MTLQRLGSKEGKSRMKTRCIHEANGQRTYVAVLEIGEEVMACMQAFAESEGLSAAQISAIGAFQDAILAFWDWDTKQYERIPVRDQVEVLSLDGDIALEQGGKPKLHLHAVLGRRDGSTVGGHLMEAHVRPTLEVLVTESPVHLRRRMDETTGLALIDTGR